MGRIYFTSKQEAENLLRLSITRLKQEDYLDGFHIGDVKWTENRTQKIISVRVMSDTHLLSDEKYVRLTYNFENQYDRDVKVHLDETECKYGGTRYWFICPVYNCGRRVGILYLKNGDFACRYCHNLTYRSRNINRRLALLFRSDLLSRKIDQLEKRIKRRYYRGLPTKLERKHQAIMESLSL